MNMYEEKREEGENEEEESEEKNVRCDNCGKVLASDYDDLIDHCGMMSVPALMLPGEQFGLVFCNRKCVIEYLQKKGDDS